MDHITSADGIDRLVEQFEHHLREVKGLAAGSCAHSAAQAREYLTEQWQRAGYDLVLAKLNGQSLLHYVTRQRRRLKPASLQQLGCHLRRLLRFLVLVGQVSEGLIYAVPRIRSGPRLSAPECLSQAQLQRLLGSVDRRTPEGARDQALILVLSQLGLRAGEASGLVLEDLDWRRRTLRLAQNKGRRERWLPLPPIVAQGLAHYLRHARPPGAHRRVFVSFPGGAPLKSKQLSALIARALHRAHLVFGRPGAHLLRHSFASRLAEGGASVKAIADLLGHRQLDTACLYVHLSAARLQRVVQPWPEVIA